MSPFRSALTCARALLCRVDTRKNLSRHRTHDPDADVDYINERNRLFNKWLSRSFDTYTKEIRDSLERGTAL